MFLQNVGMFIIVSCTTSVRAMSLYVRVILYTSLDMYTRCLPVIALTGSGFASPGLGVIRHHRMVTKTRNCFGEYRVRASEKKGGLTSETLHAQGSVKLKNQIKQGKRPNDYSVQASTSRPRDRR